MLGCSIPFDTTQENQSAKKQHSKSSSSRNLGANMIFESNGKEGAAANSDRASNGDMGNAAFLAGGEETNGKHVGSIIDSEGLCQPCMLGL